jgi:hypothetical protein
MPGKIRKLIDELIDLRAQGNQSLMSTTRTKLLLKGIDSGKFTDESVDDPVVIGKIRQIAQEMNITLKG